MAAVEVRNRPGSLVEPTNAQPRVCKGREITPGGTLYQGQKKAREEGTS